MKNIRTIVVAPAILAMSMQIASAQETTLRVLGWYPNQPQTDDVEVPLFEGLADRTGGQVRVEYRTLSELGLRPFEHLRTLQSGAFDLMTIGTSFVAGDDPVMIGHDIPGVSLSFEDIRLAVDAWRPILEQRFAEAHGARVLSAAPFPPQIFFCRGNIETLDDFRGKRIRVASGVAADLAQGMGGVAVTLAGPEVYAALQRGVIDCGVSGTVFANSNSWFEVSDTVFPLPLGGYAVFVHVIREATWQSLSEETRNVLSEQFAAAEETLWNIAASSHENGLRCNLGEQPCAGRLGSMTLTTPTASDEQRFRNLVSEIALPGWFQECERVMTGCRDEWMARVAPVVGMTP